jgi:putative oxidoreductase
MNKLLATGGINRDIGLLIIRVGVGIMFMTHGGPKLFGGPEYWENIGNTGMGNLGIHFFPVFWGFMAGFTEFFGGLCIALGLFTVPFSILLVINLIVATNSHFAQGEGLAAASHAIEAAFLFLGFIFMGPGKYSLDHKLFK